MATPLPRLDDPTPVRLPVIPKDAVFRRFCWDWLAPNGDRWDHKGNPLGKSLLWQHQNDKAHFLAKFDKALADTGKKRLA